MAAGICDIRRVHPARVCAQVVSNGRRQVAELAHQDRRRLTRQQRLGSPREALSGGRGSLFAGSPLGSDRRERHRHPGSVGPRAGAAAGVAIRLSEHAEETLQSALRSPVRCGRACEGHEGDRVLARWDGGRQKPGMQATMTGIRDGKAQELTVTIGQRSEDQPSETGGLQAPDGGKRLGLALAPIPEAARRQFGREAEVSGVLVQRVEPNSPAAENGLRPGDVIISANNQPVTSPSDVANAWSEAQTQKKAILLRDKRDDQCLFVAVPA